MKILTTMLFIFLALGVNAKDSKGKVEITVSYERQDGRGSNQYAVWIEDQNGDIVKTLYVTRFTAKGGYIKRPDCTPLWVSKANPQGMTKEQIDGFSGATPKSGNHVYTWDLTDNAGNKVEAGEYMFVVQATLLGNSQVLFKGYISTKETKEVLIKTSPEFSSNSSENKGMIKSVEAKYMP